MGNGRRRRRTLEREKHRDNHMKNNRKYDGPMFLFKICYAVLGISAYL
jgi:hypothetical protein